MQVDVAIYVLKSALTTGALIMAPVLLTGLVVGITVAAVQAATQVNEPTLTFVPKVLAVGFVFGLILPWAFQRMILLVQMVMSQAGQILMN